MIAARAGDPGEPVYLVAIPLTLLGRVLVLASDPKKPPEQRVAWKYVTTGGIPVFAFASPDERRLYATHPTEGRISIIDLGCDPLPACVEVVRTLQVGDNPTEIHFDHAGELAYVTHLFNNVISVIE